MTIPNIPAYIPTREVSRSCPVCLAPSIAMQDRMRAVVKCITCGYSSTGSGSMTDGGYYDRPVLASMKNVRKGYYEMVDNVQNALFNALIESGWNKQEAVNSIASDLQLTKEELDIFLRKVGS